MCLVGIFFGKPRGWREKIYCIHVIRKVGCVRPFFCRKRFICIEMGSWLKHARLLLFCCCCKIELGCCDQTSERITDTAKLMGPSLLIFFFRWITIIICGLSDFWHSVKYFSLFITTKEQWPIRAYIYLLNDFWPAVTGLNSKLYYLLDFISPLAVGFFSSQLLVYWIFNFNCPLLAI